MNESSADFTEISQRLTKISLNENKNFQKETETQNEREKETEKENPLKLVPQSQSGEGREQGISKFSVPEKNDPERIKKKSVTSLPSKKDRTQMIKEQHQKILDGVSSEAELKKFNEYHDKENYINNHPFRHLIFGSHVTESNFKRHITLTYRGLVYAKKCLKGPSEKFIKTKEVNLLERIGYLMNFTYNNLCVFLS